MSGLRAFVAIACLAAIPAAWPADFPDLPPERTALAAIAGHPGVLAARAGMRVQEASEQALRAGPYEFSVRGAADRRREVSTGQDLLEWGVTLERPLRLPEKSRLDEEIGRHGVDQARLAIGGAMHEAARTLLRLWFGWMKASSQAEDWGAQLAVLAQQRATVEKRVRVGDAPRQELVLAQAAVAQAEHARLQAQLRETIAASELAQTFPRLERPSRPAATPVQPLEGDFAYWRELIFARSSQLAVARGDVNRARLVASRTRSDRMPDPTFGVYYLSERDNSERVLGLSLSIPIPGDARRAAAEGAVAQIDVAMQREATVLRQLTAEVSATVASAQAAYEASRKAAEAAAGMARNAELASRAYALGEANLADVLTARRLSIETSLASTLARLDAAEARYRLMLDAYMLWPLESE